jgi:hypothetical protein
MMNATTKHMNDDSNAQKHALWKVNNKSPKREVSKSLVLLSCFYFGNSICGCLLSRKGLVAPRYLKGFDTVPRALDLCKTDFIIEAIFPFAALGARQSPAIDTIDTSESSITSAALKYRLR